MPDTHKRHTPTNAIRGNDFATKKEVMIAVKNLTRTFDERITRLERPWYLRLWAWVRRHD